MCLNKRRHSTEMYALTLTGATREHEERRSGGSVGQLLGNFWVGASRRASHSSPQPAAGSRDSAAAGSGRPAATVGKSGSGERGGTSGPQRKSRGLGSIAMGLWEVAADQLMNLEAKIVSQVGIIAIYEENRDSDSESRS